MVIACLAPQTALWMDDTTYQDDGVGEANVRLGDHVTFM
jgi:hypothetical protein